MEVSVGEEVLVGVYVRVKVDVGVGEGVFVEVCVREEVSEWVCVIVLLGVVVGGAALTRMKRTASTANSRPA